MKNLIFKYYSSLIIGIAGFYAVLIYLPSLVNINPPSNLNVYITNNDSTQLDTLVIDNSYGEFSLDSLPKNRPELLSQDCTKLAYKKLLKYQDFYYNLHPKFLLWRVAMAIGIAFSLFMLFPLAYTVWFSIVTTKSYLEKTVSFLVSLVVVLIIFYVSIGQSKMTLLPTRVMEVTGILFASNKWIMDLLRIIYLIPPMIAMTGNFMIINEILAEKRWKKVSYNIEELIRLKKMSSWFLIASSIILVMGIITSYLLRESILEALGNSMNYFFPTEFLVGYGLVFTFFLLIVYLPGNILLALAIKRKLENQENESSGISTSYSKVEYFEILISIVAPVLSSLVIEFLR